MAGFAPTGYPHFVYLAGFFILKALVDSQNSTR